MQASACRVLKGPRCQSPLQSTPVLAELKVSAPANHHVGHAVQVEAKMQIPSGYPDGRMNSSMGACVWAAFMWGAFMYKNHRCCGSVADLGRLDDSEGVAVPPRVLAQQLQAPPFHRLPRSLPQSGRKGGVDRPAVVNRWFPCTTLKQVIRRTTCTTGLCATALRSLCRLACSLCSVLGNMPAPHSSDIGQSGRWGRQEACACQECPHVAIRNSHAS